MSDDGKRILFIHGHGAKPPAEELDALWQEALAVGLRREHKNTAKAFAAQTRESLYYADKLLEHSGYDPVLDMHDRRQALATLTGLERARDFRRKHYEALPGKSALKEFAMDVSAPLATGVGLGGKLAQHMLPELQTYWDGSQEVGKQLRAETIEWLAQHIDSGSEVALVCHGFGAVIAYDAMWSLAHERGHEGKVALWLTLGAPLANDAIRHRLLGADRPVESRFPTNILHWHNIAAEDDHYCHDKTVANDFAQMLNRRVIGSIDDHVIYNLAVRYGRSEPSASVGYLVHPRTAAVLAEWMAS